MPGVLFFCSMLVSCGSLPSIATDVTYCCQPGAERLHTYRVEFEDMPEFLKPMLRDESSIALAAKGLEYTEGDADALLRIAFVFRPLTAAESGRQDAAWGSISPGGGSRFIAEVKFEINNTVSRELVWSGTMGRIHYVTEGSYMHEARARAAMHNAFADLFASYPDSVYDE